MRHLAPILLLLLAPACRCTPATAQVVTFRVKNVSRDPIFVNDTGGRLGLSVQRETSGAWSTLSEDTCACLTCESVCDVSCACDGGATEPLVRRLEPGQSSERPWAGVARVDDVINCPGTGVESCLTAQNAPVNEPFKLKLCYATRVPGFVAGDGGVGPGDFPSGSAFCLDKTFEPQELTVEIGPPVGAACTTTADCQGQDELCFDGACTSGCPANDAPTLGANWSLLVASPDDRGFFTTAPRGAATTYSGAGTLSSVVFQGSSMVLQLKRPGASGETLSGSVSIGLPPGLGAPLVEGTKVAVLVVDASTSDNPSNRAVVVREAATGALLFAADTAQAGPVLSAADVSPFTVAAADRPRGCSIEGCGKLLLFDLQVTAPWGSLAVPPGQTRDFSGPQGTWRVLSVANLHAAASAHCTFADLRPWAAWRQTGP